MELALRPRRWRHGWAPCGSSAMNRRFRVASSAPASAPRMWRDYAPTPDGYELAVVCDLDRRRAPSAGGDVPGSGGGNLVPGGAGTARHRPGGHLPAALAAPGDHRGGAGRRQACAVREAAGRLAEEVERVMRGGRAARPRGGAGLPVSLRQRARPAAAADRSRRHGPLAGRQHRDPLEPAARLLRRALARPEGDRTGRRGAGPRHPRRTTC